ncbi:Uncharacterized protein APZ42_029043 [Daphnia magna]|uniref:Reverse transcriptase/retrotransposon-derived protein RNase H-like domain-containing protein n=1 Tax=Daphnia magna TaxID=35525 RepID=A0A164PZ34_9CRUS|nr:Uncharacterized protein APZ42_029043 [Daphnia magna]
MKEKVDEGNGVLAAIILSPTLPPVRVEPYIIESCVIPAKTMKIVNKYIEETMSKTAMVERAHSACPDREWIVPHCLVNIEGKGQKLTRISPWGFDVETDNVDEVCGTLKEEDMYLPDEIKEKMTSQANITEKQRTELDVSQCHCIYTGDARPISARPRRVSTYECQIIAEQVKSVLSKGIIEPSISPWSTNLVLIKKGRPDDLIKRVAGAVIFRPMDIENAFWQVPVHHEDREKTAFVTTDGLYQFKYLSFGLCNSPITFVRKIDHALLHLNSQFALMTAPLHQLLKKEVFLEWKLEHQLAMRNIQDALLAAPTLTHDDDDGDLVLKTNASKYGLGAVLNRVKEKIERPIIFICRKTSKAEMNNHSVARVVFGQE